MLAHLFSLFSLLDTLCWGYLAFALVLALGGYLTLQSRFFQLRALPHLFREVVSGCRTASASRGAHPLKIFFTSCDLAGIVTALQLGGPGALFWVWCTVLIGSLMKYAEVYLGIKHRVRSESGGYDGGPMFFLRRAYKSAWVPRIVALLLCIYGVEIYQFAVVTDAITSSWSWSQPAVLLGLLLLVLYSGGRGIAPVAKICSSLLPLSMLLYLGLALYVIGHHLPEIPAKMLEVLKAAFSGKAAVGGALGSSFVYAIQQGVSRGAYSSDIGIGYESIVQSESQVEEPERQARLTLLGSLLHCCIYSVTLFLVLVTGVYQLPGLSGSQLVQAALATQLPGVDLWMPFLLFLLGYTTLTAYLFVGMKCARYLHAKWGGPIYLIYAALALPLFSLVGQTQALLVMSLAGSMLLMINLVGIFRLRSELSFKLPGEVTTPIQSLT